MWNDPLNALDNHLKTSHTLRIESLVVGEWNMNDFANIDDYGVYRNRPSDPTSPHYRARPDYDKLDPSDSFIDADQSAFNFSDFVDSDGSPVFKQVIDVDRKLIFDLEECFAPFRPRSGINKAMYFDNAYFEDFTTARRPRFYICSRDDKFKYWNSFRQQMIDGTYTEVGVSRRVNPSGYDSSIGYIIDDTAPFAVYDSTVPANRIIVKMQTQLADATYDTRRDYTDAIVGDPFSEESESTIPKRWRIEYLRGTDWIPAIEFDENSTRADGTSIVPWDGYVEVNYGVIPPSQFRLNFNLVDYLDDENLLPARGLTDGEAYVVGFSNGEGTLYCWDFDEDDWYTESVSYGFFLSETDDTKRIALPRTLVNPRSFTVDGKTHYTDFAYVDGLRVVVDTMAGPDKTFNLIELSPRLRVDLTQYATAYSMVKTIANDSAGIPVGGLLASNGDIQLLDHDGAFLSSNTSSIVSQYLKPNIKFEFYQAILEVDGYDKFIPVKTMYAEFFPEPVQAGSEVSIPLRDAFFLLEQEAPQMFLTDITLTGAVSILLDNIGYSNYIFKGFDDIVSNLADDRALLAQQLRDELITIEEYDEKMAALADNEEYYSSYADPVIPYFFVPPDSSVAQILVQLALSCQAAMFFDEYNNFVVMPKEHILPEQDKRSVDFELYGQETGDYLPNIINIQDSATPVINSGAINYTVRYVQKSYSTLGQSLYVDEDRNYTYKPVLLWEVPAQNDTKTVNEASKSSSGYALSAAALNTNLSASVPYVVDNAIINNTIDLGESVYWLGRFQGYLYANGEIIRYDAVEYDVAGTGKVWITSNQEYQKYFAKLPFNGKIFPTGNVRIWCEPYYTEFSGAPETSGLDRNVTYKDGPVERHGRGQFGTEVTDHQAGINPYWYDDANVRGCKMESSYLFSTVPTERITYPAEGAVGNAAGVSNDIAKLSKRGGIIKNFMRRIIPSDTPTPPRVTSPGSVQASALVFTGPDQEPSANAINDRDLITYVHKDIDGAYKHFGTRMRLIGRLKINGKFQEPTNSFEMFALQPTGAASTLSIEGGSGGIGVGVNPNTNCGYYFEIAALTVDNVSDYISTGSDSVIHNVMFYKVVPDASGKAIPKKLWGGLANILVDDGVFVGMDRLGQEDNPTVYDLAVEYENIGSIRRFYLYINNAQVAYVDDPNPLPQYTGSCLFIRGTTEAMFENFYALQDVLAKNSDGTVVSRVSSAFGDDEISTSETLNKYSLPGFVKSTYLTGAGPSSSPDYRIYFEEFGTIMREVGYFNIRYDQAYPAFSAKIAKTFTNQRGYAVSNFYAGSYGAEFLVFNTTDKTIKLDETTGNYLRILGVTFTQATQETLTVDDYMKSRSNLSNPERVSGAIKSPVEAEKVYDTIKKSRAKYGIKDYSLDSWYIQTYDHARDLMGWIIGKTINPRKTYTIGAFGVPTLQLGDIVTIDYDAGGIEPTSRFVVFEISHNRSVEGIQTALRVVEV